MCGAGGRDFDMKRLTQALFVLSVVLSLPALAHAAKPGGADRRQTKCQSCAFGYPDGTTNCWACGKRLRVSELLLRKPPVEVEPLVVRVLPDEGPGGGSSAESKEALAGPEVALEEIERGIADNPTEYGEALNSLEALLEKVLKTPLESTVRERMGEVRDEMVKANFPRTPKEREAEVIKRMPMVWKKIKDNPYRLTENVRRIEKLLKLAEGTPYEALVRRRLERHKDKLDK